MSPVTFSWPIDRSCTPLPELPDNPSAEQQKVYDDALAARNAAEDVAVFVMWALSGRQFGGEPTRLRPCPPRGWPASVYLSVSSWSFDWGWSPWSQLGCGCVGHCGLSGGTRLHLPGPVYPPSVDNPIVVTIAGEVLDPAEYVLEGNVLYRRGGRVWPGQNLARPLGEPGTWSVDYQRGLPVPPGVDRLTGVLAKEFIIACGADRKSCRLPKTLVSTSARGVTHVFDPAKIIAAKRTGLQEVDPWIAAVNPYGLMAAPEVL